MSYAFCVKHRLTMTLREVERPLLRTIYICAECEREQRERAAKLPWGKA